MKVDLIRVTELDPEDTLIVRVDTGQLPKSKAEDYMKKISDMLTDSLKHEKILVMHKGIDLEILKEES